jgi:RES domain-containing protein
MAGRKARDVDLLDALDALDREPFDGDVWRIVRDGKNPLQGYSAGARWDPPGGLDVIYTSIDPDGARAEIFFHLMRAPVFPARAVYLLHRLNVRMRKTVHLADMSALATLRVDIARYSELEFSQTQAIGDAAHFLRFDGLILPSARWDCRNLVIFMDCVDPNDDWIIGESEPVDWQAWRSKIKG